MEKMFVMHVAADRFSINRQRLIEVFQQRFPQAKFIMDNYSNAIDVLTAVEYDGKEYKIRFAICEDGNNGGVKVNTVRCEGAYCKEIDEHFVCGDHSTAKQARITIREPNFDKLEGLTLQYIDEAIDYFTTSYQKFLKKYQKELIDDAAWRAEQDREVEPHRYVEYAYAYSGKFI
jgi:hypothetical protein